MYVALSGLLTDAWMVLYAAAAVLKHNSILILFLSQSHIGDEYDCYLLYVLYCDCRNAFFFLNIIAVPSWSVRWRCGTPLETAPV